jgi:hypothetical protein
MVVYTPGRVRPCPVLRLGGGALPSHANDPGGKAMAPRHGTQSGRSWAMQNTAGLDVLDLSILMPYERMGAG